MAVYKDGKKWMIKISYRDDEGNKRYTTKRGFETKREALHFQHEYKYALEHPEVKADKTAIFQDVIDSYLNSRILSPRTLNKYVRHKTLWLEQIAQKRLEKLTDKSFLEIVTKIGKSAYSYKYKNAAIQFLRTLLTHSNDYFNTSFKPRLLLSVARKSSDVKTYSIWSVEEFEQFIQCVENPVYHAFFSFLYYTGARLGEARALYLDDVSHDGYVNLFYQVRQDELKRSDMKTASSRRTILIHDNLLQELKSLSYPRGKWLFGGKVPLSNSSITRAFKQAIEDSGVKPIRIHDLRHSHASFLISHGANILAVSKRLGHSNTAITLSVYAHLLPKIEKELIELIETGGQKVVN